MIRKGAYPCEYTDESEKVNEKLLCKKEEFYSNLNMENITDANYLHAKRIKRVFKDFGIKHSGGYHDLYLKSDTLLLADGFESFIKMCLEIYQLDPVNFLSTPGLSWQVALKNQIRIRIIY